MSRYVSVVALQFHEPAPELSERRRALVLDQVAGQLEWARGRNFDLLVTSEGVESRGQSKDEAERLDRPGPLLQLYRDFARDEKCVVVGSAKVEEDGHVFNSAVFFDADGSILGAYHKNHLIVAEIEAGLASGPGPVVFDTAAGRIGAAICFDLNFRELMNAYAALRPDIMVFPSMYHGGLMQACWAHTCRSYFVSALPFMGGGILNPLGCVVAESHCYTPHASARINLDRVVVHLYYNQKRFDEIRRKYPDEVIIDIPANIGPALIFSESQNRTAMDIVREFDLELIDDYFARSLQRNAQNRPGGSNPSVGA